MGIAKTIFILRHEADYFMDKYFILFIFYYILLNFIVNEL